jgi:MEMO1 family protein
MGFVRQAAVAGQFYPGDPAELASTVERYLADAVPGEGPAPKALIAPHAGFVYSGPIAANAYAQIRSAGNSIKRVVLLGPCHRVAVHGLALSGADSFETPLGKVEVDKPASEQILSLPQVEIFDPTHELEHSLEVHLPFLQMILDDFKLVPLVVGDVKPELVGQVLDMIWGGEETLIVVSSDLSHYLNYDEARELDGKTCTAIENLEPGQIQRAGACGRFPVGGLLDQAKKRGMQVTTLDVRNSGDTAGPKDRVVGYGSWMFSEPMPAEPVPEPVPEPMPEPVPEPDTKTETGSENADEARPQGASESTPAPTPQAITPLNENDFEEATRGLLSAHGPDLVLLAAFAIDHGLDHNVPPELDLNDHARELRSNGASFVTLKKNGELRGCIGSPQAHRPLATDVAHNAYRAAFADPRFPKLRADEREEIEISISVLSPSVPMIFENEDDFLEQLRPGIDGLIIEDRGLRALFLPSVWSQLPYKRDFVGRLKIKAGMTQDHWSTSFKALRFIAEEVSASDLG